MNTPPPIDEEELAQVAAALPLSERAAYLDAACAGHPEVRARLDSLLFARDAGEFLRAPAEPHSPEIEAQLARLKPEQAGERIGPYKLLQEIGEGGFGTVWMAEQTEPVKRRVALKIIKIGMDTKEVVARFEQERQALAMMDHPNIAKVFDAGATQWGRPYFVMELVRGVPITDYCDEQKLPVPKRLALFIEVCQALQHAHQKGIIHRDLKPSNILVTVGDDHEPVPKVIDFGVAKAMDRTLTEKTLFTQFEQIIGTPAYMSPEQAGVGPMDIDTRSDIYSLGVLLYEMLTGKPPFDPSELHKAGHDEMRRVIREEDPPRPSTRLSTLKEMDLTAVATRRQIDATKLASIIRGDLDWIVMKALEKNRNRRYETANGLAMEIRRHLAHEPVLARPPSFGYKAGKFIRRYKVPVAAAAAILVALTAGLVASTILYLRERAAWKSEAAQRTAAESHAQAELREHQRADANAVAEAQQRKLAVASALESKDRLVRLHVANGTRLMKEGDSLASLAWFVEALRLDQDEREKAAVHQLRIQSVISQSPQLLQMWFHAGVVGSAQFSRDGRFIATGSADGMARILDSDTGKAVTSPLRHSEAVESTSFSPDGRRIVIVTKKNISVCDVVSGETTIALNHPGAEDARFSPDGRLIATASVDGTIKIWDAQTWGERIPGVKHSDRAGADRNRRHLSFSPDSRRLLTFSFGNEARIWDVQTGELVFSLLHNQTVRHACFNPNGNLIATANFADTAHLWEATTGKELFPPLVHGGMVDHVTFSPDGKWLVSSGLDGTVKFREAATGQLVRILTIGKTLVLESTFSPDGNLLMTRSLDGRVHLWSVHDGKLAAPVLRHSWWATSAQFHPDGRLLLTASNDGSVRLWDLKPEGLQFWPWPDAGISALGWSPRGTRLLAETDSGGFQVWNVKTRQPIPVNLSFSHQVVRGFFSNDDRRLLTIEKPAPTEARQEVAWESKLWDLDSGMLVHSARIPFESALLEPQLVAVSGDGTQLSLTHRGSVRGQTVEVWDLVTGRQLWRSEGHAENGRLLSFSPDASQVVLNCGNVLHVWHAKTGKGAYKSLTNRMALHAAIFTQNSQRIVTVDSDTTYRGGDAKIWNASTGELLHALHHSDGVTCAAFSSDNSWLATGGESREARVFDVESGKPISPRLIQEGTVISIAFSPSGRFLATGTTRAAQVWDLATGEPVTPPLKHAGEVEEVFFPAADEILITRAAGRYRFWRLPLDQSASEALQLRAQLLAAHRLDATGVLEPLEVRSLTDAWNRLKLLAKDVGMSSKGPGAVPEMPLGPLRSPIAMAKRDPRASANLLDLTRFYDVPLAESFHSRKPDNNLAEMPQGLSSYAGVEFDARGVIQLLGGELMKMRGPIFRKDVRAIPVKLPCTRIHALLSTSAREAEGTQIGTFILHYSDGEQAELPIVYGQHTREWQVHADDNERQVKDAVLAWVGQNDYTRKAGGLRRIYKATWNNPRLEMEVSSVDFTSTMSSCGPFLIAITVE